MNRKLTFSLIGGTLQPEVSSFADFPAILKLDDARWALTSISRHAVRADERLLDYLDEDGNERIRCDEIRAALRFMLDHFASGTGVDEGSSVLKFSDLAADHPDTPKILSAARKILVAQGKPDADSISLEELKNERELRENASFGNGGKLVPGDGGSPDAEKLLNRICACIHCETVGMEEIDRFASAAQEELNWRHRPLGSEKEYYPFGAETSAAAAHLEKTEQAVDAYFLQCDTLSFLASAPGRTPKTELNADPLDAGEISDVLQKLTLASPRRDGALDLAEPLNPLYRGELDGLFRISGADAFLDNGKLRRDAWEKLKAALAVFQAWHTDRPQYGAFFDVFSDDEVSGFAARSGFAALEEAIRRNTILPDGIRLLCKLLLFQRDMLKFLRNYVSLADLFDIRTKSMLLCGEIVLDARRFTLVTPVGNLALHKKITEGSNICIAYIEVKDDVKPATPARLMAVGITAGDMKRLFAGKHGIFYDPSGKALDAVIVDFVEQPVSFWEALKSPFVRFGKLISEQSDRLFSASTAKKQQQIAPPGGTPQAATTSGLPMLIMGGGIGIAALGSAVAFIANTLKTVSFVNILYAIIGIFLIFSGPPVIHALIKLFSRDLGRFLEASGCAVNFPMRLSFRLGYYFTRSPGVIGSGSILSRRRRFWLIVLASLVAIGLGIAGFFVWRHFRAKEKTQCVPVCAPAVPVETEKKV